MCYSLSWRKAMIVYIYILPEMMICRYDSYVRKLDRWIWNKVFSTVLCLSLKIFLSHTVERIRSSQILRRGEWNHKKATTFSLFTLSLSLFLCMTRGWKEKSKGLKPSEGWVGCELRKDDRRARANRRQTLTLSCSALLSYPNFSLSLSLSDSPPKQNETQESPSSPFQLSPVPPKVPGNFLRARKHSFSLLPLH